MFEPYNLVLFSKLYRCISLFRRAKRFVLIGSNRGGILKMGSKILEYKYALLFKSIHINLRMGVFEETARIGEQGQFENLLKNVWADHADMISIQYSGTGALKTDFTR